MTKFFIQMVTDINAQELNQFIQAGEGEIIDVREQDEFDLIRMKNSKLIPMGEILDRLEEIDWNKKVVLICRTGSRSAHIAKKISVHGKDVYNLEKGIKEIYSKDIENLVFSNRDLVDRYF